MFVEINDSLWVINIRGDSPDEVALFGNYQVGVKKAFVVDFEKDSIIFRGLFAKSDEVLSQKASVVARKYL